MNTFLADMRDALVPGRDVKYGPLPPLLVAMTLVTGLVDAFSYLLLGHVFVANMTGNIVFLGFAIAGAPGFSIPSSLVALVSFYAGAMASGRFGSRVHNRRDRLLSISVSIQVVLFSLAVVLSVIGGSRLGATFHYVLIIALGIAMGTQNATARRLAVPDLNTTVLTLTITGMASDNVAAGGAGSKAGRRLLAVVTIFLGALIGAMLIVHAERYLPLIIALIITVVVAMTAWMLGRSDPSWVKP